MSFAVGSLVRARGREWVVLPSPDLDSNLLLLRPLAGTDDETTGIYLPLERVESAAFALPDPKGALGNHRSAALLRDAIRLGLRSSAGPFRSMGRIGIEPRPYQLVPLLMALRLDPVRILIADDVGVGKTIEACLIARELLDRGEVRRLAVLCPPHLADQWRRALIEQFHIDAKLVGPSTAGRLEREGGLSPHDSIFDRYPQVVVSVDYIKSERRRHEFLRTCPELVIVDEAHGCAPSGLGRAAQLRHALLEEISRSGDRHLVLVTATPHSGKQESFRALLGLLDRSLLELPADLSGEWNRRNRETLARHFIQRRRGDIHAYLDTETPFPERLSAEETYRLSTAYRGLFDKVLAYCRESVHAGDGDERRKRVRWWSALALLRSLGSSPMAAAATLRNRAASAETTSVEEADEVGRRTVLDQDEELVEGLDVVPGSEPDLPDDADESVPERRKLQALAREAESLAGKEDLKLAHAMELIAGLLDEGRHPIIFCRFIPTVEYVVAALRGRLHDTTLVEGITGLLAPEERERRVESVGASERRVVVCTDCLSEGINLQHYFDAVVHYDLSWSPTRHEQREGRVDRYGQKSAEVKTITYYGSDNPIDGIVLDVLLRKHRAILKQLGIFVPIPMDTNAIMEAVFEGLLLRGKETLEQLSFDFLTPEKREVDGEWDRAAEREQLSRTLYAQRSIRVEDVAREVVDAKRAVGGRDTVEWFSREALQALGARVSSSSPARIQLQGLDEPARDRLAPEGEVEFDAVFEEPAGESAVLLTRTHPFVTTLADYVWSQALDERGVGPARRAAAIRTEQVDTRTTILLLRLRFHIVTQGEDGGERPLLAEETVTAGFEGSAENPTWIAVEVAEGLLDATPSGNVAAELARERLEGVLDSIDALSGKIEEIARERAAALLDAHRRVRKASRQRVRSLRVEPHLPPDVIGVFVYLPRPGGPV